MSQCAWTAPRRTIRRADPQPCAENEFVVVTAHSTYTPVSLLGFLGTIQIESKARIQMPLSQNR